MVKEAKIENYMEIQKQRFNKVARKKVDSNDEGEHHDDENDIMMIYNSLTGNFRKLKN